MRNTRQTLDWYRENEVYPEAIGFDPDGMCQKIVRTARNIPAVYPSALSSQEATPEEHRIYDPADIKVGMVGYFDDPNDSNPFGHVITWSGRVAGEDRSKLSSLLARTNSVRSNRIVVVRGDYFQRYWGDAYQFSATWLNGQELLGFGAKKKAPLGKAAGLNRAVKTIEKSIEHHKKKGHKRLVRALERDLASLKETIDKFNGSR